MSGVVSERRGITLVWSSSLDHTSKLRGGCGSLVVKVSDRGLHVTSSSLVPLKTRRVGERCTLNLSRAQMSSRWCDLVVRRGGACSGVVHVTSPWFKITWPVTNCSHIAL
ncbi:uncharacterized protein TNCV_658441 [Trichonephila clavipes]|uniref:Uncharacterized protein n=1 Tax=Trichonephila clavipes TaxID=2585209 RepID=A0A8X6SSG5_TRICX|nr:uncharacterized protein TNCV_658441 [Trichonephila clavipes]